MIVFIASGGTYYEAGHSIIGVASTLDGSIAQVEQGPISQAKRDGAYPYTLRPDYAEAYHCERYWASEHDWIQIDRIALDEGIR